MCFVQYYGKTRLIFYLFITCKCNNFLTATDGEPFIIRWILRPLIIGNLLHNMGEMEDYLNKECQDIDYTVVRPPGLTNQPSTGNKTYH